MNEIHMVPGLIPAEEERQRAGAVGWAVERFGWRPSEAVLHGQPLLVGLRLDGFGPVKSSAQAAEQGCLGLVLSAVGRWLIGGPLLGGVVTVGVLGGNDPAPVALCS